MNLLVAVQKRASKSQKEKMIIYGKPLKEFFKEGWNVFPAWLWACNIGAIAFGLWIIFFMN